MTIPRPLCLSIVLGCLSTVVACGAAKPAEPASPVAAPSPTAQTQRPDPPPPATPALPSNVAISDEIRSKCGIPDADAYFPFDSAHVTSNDRTPLDLVARCFTKGALAGHAVKLIGRADPRGESDYNITLGQSRADAVGAYLSARGIDKGKTQSTTRGAMDASGTDESGWQKDRRVDVMLGN